MKGTAIVQIASVQLHGLGLGAWINRPDAFGAELTEA